MDKEYLKISSSFGCYITEIKEFNIGDIPIEEMLINESFTIEKIEMDEEEYYSLQEFGGF